MRHILLVDDDMNSRLTLSALLEDEGFVITLATSYSEARTLLASGTTADLFILDHHLKDGLGTDLFRFIREIHPSARVVLLSGSMENESIPSELSAFVEKGSAFEELMSVIGRVLA